MPNRQLPAFIGTSSLSNSIAGAVSGTAAKRSRRRPWMAGLAVLAMGLAAGSAAPAQTAFGSSPLGTPVAAQSVTVTATVAGQVSQVEVLTMGASGLDYSAAASGSNCVGANLAVGQTCTEQVVFTPTAPGQRLGAVVLVGSGQTLGTSWLTGTGVGALGVFIPGVIGTVAGNGQYSAVLDGQPATSANLFLPTGVAVDGAGNLYIADSNHNRIRKVTQATGLISTIAGNGNLAYTGDNGPAISASLNTPSSVALDAAGNIYIADTGNNVVRRIDGVSGIITTFAGSPTGAPGSTGDNGPATAALLSGPWGVTLDAAGNVYIADTGNHRIREVLLASGVINTVAGNGTTNPDGSGTFSGDGGLATAAGLNSPYAVGFDAAGNFYIPDQGNNRIREVTIATGKISTVAGNGSAGYSGDSVKATATGLYHPQGVAFDAAGNLFIADTGDNRVRKVSGSTGVITTIAGSANAGFSGDTGPATSAGLYGPYSVALDGQGDIFIADFFDNRIREAQANLAVLEFATAVRQGSVSSPEQQVLENDGNTGLDLTAITPGTNTVLNAGTTTCAIGTPYLAGNAQCSLGGVFAPTVAGNPLTGTIDVTGGTPNSPLVLELTGDALPVNSTDTVVTGVPNPSNFGGNVSLTAMVSTGAGTGNLTGTVTFLDGTTVLATKLALNTAGQVNAGKSIYTLATLAVGAHAITAVYSGDLLHFASTSAVMTQTVNESTKTALSSSANPAGLGVSVTLTAVVSPSNGGGVVPDGTVTFSDGGTALSTVTLDATGTATFTTSTLADGVHDITAVYSGDAANFLLGSTSNLLVQSVVAPSSAVLASNSNPAGYGTPVTLTAIVTPGGSLTPTGAVVFLDGVNTIGSGTLSGNPATVQITLSNLATGSHSITAHYDGDTANSVSTSPAVTEVITQEATTTTLAANPNPGVSGKPVVLTATVKPTAGTETPTGKVTFTDGSTTLGSSNLGAGGTATLSIPLSGGAHTLVATYGGDTNNTGSASAAQPFTVQLAATTTTLTATPSPVTVLSAVTLKAVVAGNGGVPTGKVTFAADGNTIGSATLDGTGTATLPYSSLPVGTHALTATYSGDANDGVSTSSAVSEVVDPIATVTALSSSSSGGTPPQVVLVAVVVAVSGPPPAGTVTFMDGTTKIGQATLNASGAASYTPSLAPGTYSITAVYSGDADHSPSTSAPVTITTATSVFSLNVTPPTLTLKTGQNGSLTVSLASVGGGTDTIGLGCGSLPAGVTCHFASPTVDLAANGKKSVALTIDTNSPLSGGTTAANRPDSGPPNRTARWLAGIWLPVSLFFGGLLWFRRRRLGPAWTTLAGVAAFLLLSTLAVTGCGGFTQTTVKPGTYTIQVTGVGANTNVTQYQNVTLDITQ